MICKIFDQLSFFNFETHPVPENGFAPDKNSQIKTIKKCVKSLQNLKLTVHTDNISLNMYCYNHLCFKVHLFVKMLALNVSQILVNSIRFLQKHNLIRHKSG